MFQEGLQFKNNCKYVIILFYSKQNIFKIDERVPPFLTWHIFQIIMNLLSLVMSACVLNMQFFFKNLQSNNLKSLFFVSKKWSNNLRVDCKPLSNLVEMTKNDFDFEED
jgi:hypothetical protein